MPTPAGGYDEAMRLRIGDAEVAAALARAVEDGHGSATILAKTVTVSSYPTAAASFFGCQPVSVLGAEAEGGPGSLTVITQTFYALNLGSTVPSSGTYVLCTFTGNRWVFRYDS